MQSSLASGCKAGLPVCLVLHKLGLHPYLCSYGNYFVSLQKWYVVLITIVRCIQCMDFL